jgi:hypothetical protein
VQLSSDTPKASPSKRDAVSVPLQACLAAGAASALPLADDADGASAGGEMCLICFEKKRCMLEMPCGHVNTCLECFHKTVGPRCMRCRRDRLDSVQIQDIPADKNALFATRQWWLRITRIGLLFATCRVDAPTGAKNVLRSPRRRNACGAQPRFGQSTVCFGIDSMLLGKYA